MEKNSGSVLDMKRSCLVTKSVKRLLNEFQCVYGEKLRRLEGEIKGSQEEILRVGEHPKPNHFLLDLVNRLSFGYYDRSINI